MTRIGFIDSGVARRHLPRVERARAFALRDQQVAIAENSGIDALGHGSALADLLIADPRHDLLVARVFVDRLVTTPMQLAAAFDWMTVERVPLICVSAGLREDRKPLRAAVERSIAVGTMIVAASPARGAPVFPAAYENVLRATGDARCAPGEVSWLGTPQADFGACVQSGEVQGASAACAYVVARVASLHADGMTRSQALLALRDAARHQGREHRDE